MTVSRDAAWALLTEWTQSDSLRKHALAVEAAVRGYARHQAANEEEWGVVALLHDFDYERYPTLGDHPNKGCDHLRALGYPEWVMRAIRAHAWEITGVQPETALERTLVACDEMAGFVTAAALVRPSKSVLDLEASSVRKRMKDKAFARAVPREHLQKGAELLGLPLEEHIGNVIQFMRLEAEPLGLKGSLQNCSTLFTRVVRRRGAVYPVVWRVLAWWPRVGAPLERLGYLPGARYLTHRLYFELKKPEERSSGAEPG